MKLKMKCNFEKLISLLLFSFLVGCAASDRNLIEDRNKLWIGHSMNELNTKRGPPSFTETKSNGGAVFTYIQNNKGSNKVCKETFTTNVQLIISQTKTFMCLGPPAINPIGK